MTSYSLSRLAYRLDWFRRRSRKAAAIELVFEDLLSTWDKPQFVRRMRPFWDPFAGNQPAKYLVLDSWLREAVRRYLALGIFEDGCPRRVLDIGAGTGYFLVVCRHMGHDVMALDLGNEPLYNECIEFFGLPRVVHRVEPRVPLPTFGEPLDVITAFMATFDLLPGGDPWRSSDWDYFLNDVRQRLRPGGKLVIGLNTHHSDRFLSEFVSAAHRAGYARTRIGDHMVLTAR